MDMAKRMFVKREINISHKNPFQSNISKSLSSSSQKITSLSKSSEFMNYKPMDLLEPTIPDMMTEWITTECNFPEEFEKRERSTSDTELFEEDNDFSEEEKSSKILYVFDEKVLKKKNEILIKNLFENQESFDNAHIFEKISHLSDTSVLELAFISQKIPISKKRQVNIYLPFSNEGKKTLFLDIDETLVHTLRPDEEDLPEDLGEDCANIINLDFIKFKLRSIVRPYLNEFLKAIQSHYEIICYTAADRIYAQKVREAIDPNQNIISFILSREDCFIDESGTVFKDINILKNRNITDMIIVDDCVLSAAFQPDNYIPIKKFMGNKRDDELVSLAGFLLTLLEEDDVRPSIRNQFHISSFIDNYKKSPIIQFE